MDWIISMDYGWLNVGSFLLGLIALACPFIYFIRRGKYISNDACAFTAISACACATSIFFQIVGLANRVKIEDWLDIINPTVQLSLILLSLTLALNLIAVILHYKRKGI